MRITFIWPNSVLVYHWGCNQYIPLHFYCSFFLTLFFKSSIWFLPKDLDLLQCECFPWRRVLKGQTNSEWVPPWALFPATEPTPACGAFYRLQIFPGDCFTIFFSWAVGESLFRWWGKKSSPSLISVSAAMFPWNSLTHLSQLLHIVFYYFWNTFSQRHHQHHWWFQLWAAVGIGWNRFCPAWRQSLSLLRGHPCIGPLLHKSNAVFLKVIKHY